MSHTCDSNRCRILQSWSRSSKRSNLPPNDSFLSLSTEMVEILGLRAKVSFLWTKRRGNKIEALPLKGVQDYLYYH